MITCRKLLNQEFAEALKIRIKVFVEEQHVPLEEEHDELDQLAQHFGLFVQEELVGTGRLVIQNQAGQIGRIAVLPEFRGRGLGRTLVAQIMKAGWEQGVQELSLAAQLQAIPFYEKLGFRAEGKVFLDGGIPHRLMRCVSHNTKEAAR